MSKELKTKLQRQTMIAQANGPYSNSWNVKMEVHEKNSQSDYKIAQY